MDMRTASASHTIRRRTGVVLLVVLHLCGASELVTPLDLRRRCFHWRRPPRATPPRPSMARVAAVAAIRNLTPSCCCCFSEFRAPWRRVTEISNLPFPLFESNCRRSESMEARHGFAISERAGGFSTTTSGPDPPGNCRRRSDELAPREYAFDCCWGCLYLAPESIRDVKLGGDKRSCVAHKTAVDPHECGGVNTAK